MAPDLPVPLRINGGRVLLYSRIDERHRATGACRHTVGGEPLGPVAALVIIRHKGDRGFYLYYCDEAGRAMTDPGIFRSTTRGIRPRWNTKA